MKNLLSLFVILFVSSSAFAAHHTTHPTSAPRTLAFDSDIEPALKQQMQDDLAFMAQIQGNAATPFHQQIFGKVDGSAYGPWFTSRIFSVGKDDCGSANAVACVIPFEDANKMWITPNFTGFNHPQIARVSILYHEARHSESQNGNWGHATCPTPFRDAQGHDMVSIWTGMSLAGQPGCDVTYKGSYGSQTILLKNISLKCTNCTQKVKDDADIFATDQLGRIINANVKAQMVSDFTH